MWASSLHTLYTAQLRTTRIIWPPASLTESCLNWGKRQASELSGKVKQKFDSFYSSDLRRARKSAEIAFGDQYDIKLDPRLRECDYGDFTGRKFDWDLKKYIDKPYPNGESYMDVEKRVRDLLIHLNKQPGKHVGLMGHQGPQLTLEVICRGLTWEEAIESDWREVGEWQPGWSYSFDRGDQK